MSRRDAPAFDEKTLQAHQADRGQQQRGFVRIDELLRSLEIAARGGKQDADNDERAEEIDDEGLKVEIEAPAHDRRAEVCVERDDGCGDSQDDEAVTDEGMK